MGILADWQIERDIGITPFEKYDRKKQAGKISWGLGSYGYDPRAGYVFDIFSPIGAKEIDPKNFDKGALVRVDLTPRTHSWDDDPFMPGMLYCRHCEGRTRDPKNTEEVCIRSDHILIPPHSFALAETLESFDIPRDVLCIVTGKSTLARCGLLINVTPGEPEWRGKWTVEISNTTPLPVRVYAGEGIMQCMFFRTDGVQEAVVNTVHALAARAGGGLKESFGERIDQAMCRVSYADKKGRYQGQTGLTLPTAVPVAAEPNRDPGHPSFDPALATFARPTDPNRIVTDRTGMTWRWHEDEGKWRMAGLAKDDDPNAGLHTDAFMDRVLGEGEIILDNNDPAVPDEVLARIKTRVVPIQPTAEWSSHPTIWPSGTITSDPVAAPRPPQPAAPPPEPQDPNLPPDPPPPDYVNGNLIFYTADGAGWRYSVGSRCWRQVTSPR